MEKVLGANQIQPTVINDPRFRAGRKLIQEGKAHCGAVNMFAVLSEETVAQFGDQSVEAATAMYEYGNALFSAIRRREIDEKETDADAKIKAEGQSNSKKPKVNGSDSREEAVKVDHKVNDEEDLQLAQQLMETSLAIHEHYVEQKKATRTENLDTKTKESPISNKESESYLEWSCQEIPRILTGLGDICTFKKRFADAFNSYLQAIPLREASLKEERDMYEATSTVTRNLLMMQRHAVEINVLAAEALLSCPSEKDIVPSTTNDILLKGGQIIDFVNEYYQKARAGLQEIVFLMGKSDPTDVTKADKEDVCFLSTMLMNVGVMLTANDDEASCEKDNRKRKKVV